MIVRLLVGSAPAEPAVSRLAPSGREQTGTHAPAPIERIASLVDAAASAQEPPIDSDYRAGGVSSDQAEATVGGRRTLRHDGRAAVR